MFKRGMDSQGQLSVEYLLLLVVIFAVFGGMITYLIGPSIDASNDISDVSSTSNAINSIANAVNIVYANGLNSKRTLRVYIPVDNTKITVCSTGLSSNITLSDNTTKNVSATTAYPMAPYTYTLSKGWHTVTIRWSQASGIGSGISSN